MTYKIVVYPDAEDQIAALPMDLWPAFAGVMQLMRTNPWSGRLYNQDKPDAPTRELLFGPNGAGVVTYMVLEGPQYSEPSVHVTKVQWHE